MNRPSTTRRGFLGAVALAAAARPGQAALPPGPLRLTVRETAGLRRFGYPVHVVLPAGVAGPFRLERDGKPVAAQFSERPADGSDRRVAVDFNASPGPFETETYILRHGRGTEPAAAPSGGIRAERVGDAYHVLSGGSLRYEVPADLAAIVRSVSNGRQEFIAPGQAAPGFWVATAESPDRRIGVGGEAVESTLVQNGPFAVSIRFTVPIVLPGGPRLNSTVECRFPNSKSWVETTWSVDDPDGRLAALGAGFGLRIEGEPTLLDFGASDTVYGTIQGQERMTLEGGGTLFDPPSQSRPAWLLRKGSGPGQLPLFARSKAGGWLQGWAHVMDRTRCTALALADFGKIALDRLDVAAKGRVEMERWYLPPGPASPTDRSRGTKSLRFWAHFVPMPVQVGALTSPQAMLTPLVTRWDPPPG